MGKSHTKSDFGARPLSRDSQVALYVQIAEHLHLEIESGLYGSSGRLPSEQALVARFGVSRVTVRLAIGRLMNDGLVVRKQGKGTFVAGTLVRHNLKDLKGFYDTFVSQGLNPKTELLKFETARPPPEVADVLGVEKGNLVLLQRLYRLDNVPIGLVTTWLPIVAKKVTWAEAESHYSYSILQDLLGLAVARAEISIRGQRAGKVLGKVLRLTPESPVLVLERISFGPRDEPREFARFSVNSETYEFRLNAEGPLPLKPGIAMSVISLPNRF